MVCRAALMAVLGLLVAQSRASVPSMSLTVTGGSAMVWNQGVGGWGRVSDTSPIAFGDSIFIDKNETATLKLGNESQVLLKGLCRAAVGGAGLDITVALVEGQLFLKRNQPYEFNTFSVLARGCRFTPIGTAGAVKFSKAGEPTVAMVQGKMRMESPSGEALIVEPGQVGTLQNSGSLAQGAVTPQTMTTLEEWSGVRYEGPSLAAAAQQPAPAAPAAPAVAATPIAPAAEPVAAPADEEQKATEQETDDTKGVEKGVAQGEDSDEGGDGEGETQPREREKASIVGGATIATVDGEQWTLISLGFDLPIWKFGVFLDLELWVNAQGNISDKGWVFDRDNWYKSVFRKIRYVRFGHAGDPFYVKFGGLSSVSLGYGFVVDRFTNMLHYPDQKLLGLQLELNDLGPIGLTYQGLIGDFYDFGNDGGLIASRLGFKFLKKTDVPIIKDLMIAGTYAIDRNLYAPARDWDYSLTGTRYDRDGDSITDSAYIEGFFGGWSNYDSVVAYYQAQGDYDTRVEHADQWASSKWQRFQVIGGDIGMPLIKSKLLRIDLYGQAATRLDEVSGWGFGAPGVMLTVVPSKQWFWIGAEYRHVSGKFQPGFFGTYYLDERLMRTPYIHTKLDSLPTVALDGIFGRMGANFGDVIIVSGDYQYLGAGSTKAKDQRYEASVRIGDKLMEKIPKFTRAEFYARKTRVGERVIYNGQDANDSATYRPDDFFEKSPYLYWGYRIGFEITKGSTLIWDTRHGWKYDRSYKLKENNTISIATVFSF